MRLIDADKIPVSDEWQQHTNDCMFELPKEVIEELVRSCSVEAIPVEWIEKYIAEAPTHYLFVRDMLEDWRKVNDIYN